MEIDGRELQGDETVIKRPRQHDEPHLIFIRQVSCVICGDNTSTEAAHLRYADLRAAKHNPGHGAKPSDNWTLPLCGKHHREQHQGSECVWWEAKGLDPTFLSMALFLNSGDHEAAETIIRTAHERRS